MFRNTSIGVLVAAMGAWLVFTAAAEALAGSRITVPGSSYVPRSSYNGVSPGTFGGAGDVLNGRIERDAQQIRRFQERSRVQQRQREVLREQRDATRYRPSQPGNRLTDRLRPDVEPLGNIPDRPVEQADREGFIRAPESPSAGTIGTQTTPNFGWHMEVEPYAHIDRNMR